jgi:glycosyltransferase involved in cell wall biosynthesis
MSLADRVSAVVVNYRTPSLLDTAVRSFSRFYPHVPLLVVDNGSDDASCDVISALRTDFHNVAALLLDENRYHGPAMDLALRRLDADYAFLLDSDTETRKGGFLEDMVALCAPADVYGAGKVVHVNRRGFKAPSGTPVLVSAFMLLDRRAYLELPPFIHHGLPVLRNFRAAADAGFRLEAFPVDTFVAHLGRGTAERFGYGLGLKGRVDYLLNKLGL